LIPLPNERHLAIEVRVEEGVRFPVLDEKATVVLQYEGSIILPLMLVRARGDLIEECVAPRHQTGIADARHLPFGYLIIETVLDVLEWEPARVRFEHEASRAEDAGPTRQLAVHVGHSCLCSRGRRGHCSEVENALLEQYAHL